MLDPPTRHGQLVADSEMQKENTTALSTFTKIKVEQAIILTPADDDDDDDDVVVVVVVVVVVKNL